MADSSAEVEIPRRALFRAAEVCDFAKVQPYVLRSWEGEFPDLGIARTAGGPRVYRRMDVEQVMRIKHLLLVEGLTLAGARRRLEEDATPMAADRPLDELIGQNARERITDVKRGLRAILELLAGRNSGQPLRLIERSTSPPARPVPVGRAKPSRGKLPATPRRAAPATTARRKRSA